MLKVDWSGYILLDTDNLGGGGDSGETHRWLQYSIKVFRTTIYIYDIFYIYFFFFSTVNIYCKHNRIAFKGTVWNGSAYEYLF